MKYLIVLFLILNACNKTIVVEDPNKYKAMEKRIAVQEALNNANADRLTLHEQRLEILETKVTEITNDLEEINQKVANLQETDVNYAQQLTDLQNQIEEIKIEDAENKYQVNLKIDQLNEKTTANELKITQLQALLDNTTEDINTIRTTITRLETMYDNKVLEIDNRFSEIQSLLDDLLKNVTKIIYPCGPGNSREILLKIDNTYLIAFFLQSATEQYLSVLPDGWYRTTDGFSCTFQVIKGEIVK